MSDRKRLVRYLGDATHLGLALFQDEDGQVHGYDGEHLYRASGILPDRPRVLDLASSKRTFLSTNASLFELRQDGQTLRLEELMVPSPHHDLLFTHFFDLSGEVTAILRQGVYVVDKLELKPVWVPEIPERIDTTSHLQPHYLPQLSGVLFASIKAVSGIPQLQLLTHCSGSN